MKTKTVCFDTLFRPNYSETESTHFSIHLSEPIEKVMAIKLAAMELPNMWYSVSKKNGTNVFEMILSNFYQYDEHREKVFIEERIHIIEIPDGNYRADYFENTLNTIFTNTKGGLDFLKVEIDEISAKTVIRARTCHDIGTNPKPYEPEHDLYSPDFFFRVRFLTPEMKRRNQPLNRTLGWMMGFKKESYEIGFTDSYMTAAVLNREHQEITYHAYLASESSYGNSVFQYVFLEVSEGKEAFRKDEVISNPNLVDRNMDILARITVSSSHNTVVIDNGSDQIFKKREYTIPVKIGALSIRLLDKFGEVIDLNGNDYSFLLEFTVLE
jgi:hypothetical protein